MRGTRGLLPPLVVLASAALLFGCGGSDDDSSGSTDAGAAAEQPAKTIDPPEGSTGPQSAGDSEPDAPDNAITDRPGGSADQGDGKQDSGKQDSGKKQESGGATGSSRPY